MSNFQIHELTEKAIDRNSNIIHDTLNGGSYETGKTLVGAVADLALEVVASEYDDTASYAIGSYCIYSGVLYRCATATTGVFDVSDWIAVLITGEYKRVRVMHKADFDLLTPEEKADGMIFVDDVDITADDIPYSAGVSVADKLDSLNITTITHTITKNSGVWSVNESTMKKTGHVVSIHIKFKGSGSVASGANCFQGNLNVERPLLNNVSSAGYFGAYPITSVINPDGNIYVRNTNSSAIDLGTGDFNLCFTYISAN